MDLTEFTKKYFTGLTDILSTIPYEDVEKMVKVIMSAGENGNTIFFCGNGGSASLASHLAADIGKNTVNDKKFRFKTMSLTDNISWLTALGNDLSYEDVFVEQLKNFAQNGDVLFVVSASGNSQNILKAIRWANANGLKTVGLLGFQGGEAKNLLDLNVLVPINHYGYVEGVHSEIHHCIVEALKLLINHEPIPVYNESFVSPRNIY